MSVANFLSTAVSKILGYFFSPVFHGFGYGAVALMQASWSDSRARQKILDKLNDARTNENLIQFPHIWNNVSVNNKIIRNPKKFENFHLVLPGDNAISYYHPSTLGYNYECDVNYPNWHGSKLEYIRKEAFASRDIYENGCDSRDPIYAETRDKWLIDNPLTDIGFNYDKLKGSIDITKEDNEIIKRGVESGVSAVQQIKQAVPGPEPEPGLGSRGGKHKSRRVTKHKRK